MVKEQIEKKKGRGPKGSVCAEVYGKFNQKGHYEPKVIAKDDDVKGKLMERLNQAFMFSSLEDKILSVIKYCSNNKKRLFCH